MQGGFHADSTVKENDGVGMKGDLKGASQAA